MSKIYVLDKKNKKKYIKKKKLRYRVYPVLLFFLCLCFGFIYYMQYRSYQALNDEVAEISRDINKELTRKKKLQKQISSYDNDEYIEKIAREKLGMIKSDEIVFLYSDK